MSIESIALWHKRARPEPNEAQIGDFHMSLFTLDEWVEFSGLIEKAIKEVTK